MFSMSQYLTCQRQTSLIKILCSKLLQTVSLITQSLILAICTQLLYDISVVYVYSQSAEKSLHPNSFAYYKQQIKMSQHLTYHYTQQTHPHTPSFVEHSINIKHTVNSDKLCGGEREERGRKISEAVKSCSNHSIQQTHNHNFLVQHLIVLLRNVQSIKTVT